MIQGSICRTIEKDIDTDREELTWSGLNDLPYGRYTLELSQGDDEMKMNLVKGFELFSQHCNTTVNLFQIAIDSFFKLFFIRLTHIPGTYF